MLVFYPVLRLLSRFCGEDIAEGKRGFTVAMAILAHVCESMLTGRVGVTHRELLDALSPLVLAQARATRASASIWPTSTPLRAVSPSSTASSPRSPGPG